MSPPREDQRAGQETVHAETAGGPTPPIRTQTGLLSSLITFGLFRTFGATAAETIHGWNVLSFGSDGTSPEPFANSATRSRHLGSGPHRTRSRSISIDGSR